MISIIMPTYNRGYIIETAVDSVKRQTYQDYELIIVDDGSTDDTAERIKNYKDTNIKYYLLECNKGANYARNYGITQANGEFLAFLDTDNVWDDCFLENRIQTLYDKNADFVFGRIMRVSGEKEKIWPDNPVEEMSNRESVIKTMFFGNLIDTNTVLMKKKCCIEVNGFDEKLQRFQDWDMFFRILCRDEFHIFFSDDVLVKGNIQKNSISNQTDLYWEARLYIFKKYISLYREKGCLFDVVYYLINSSQEYNVSEEIELKILTALEWSDLIGIFPKMKKMNVTIQESRKYFEMSENTFKGHMNDFRKNEIIMRLQQSWLKIMKYGGSVAESLLKLNIKRVIIYGYGVLGESLYEMLKGTEIEIAYFMDQNKRNVQAEIDGIKYLHNIHELKKITRVDAIIITPVMDYTDLLDELSKYTDTLILPIHKLIEGEVKDLTVSH